MVQPFDNSYTRLNIGYLFRGISRGLTHLEEETYILQAFHAPFQSAYRLCEEDHEQAYLTRWADTSFPLKVYFSPDYGFLFNPIELKQLAEVLRQTLNRFQQVDPNQFSFILVQDRAVADIVFKWRKCDGFAFGHCAPVIGREHQLKQADIIISIPKHLQSSNNLIHPQIRLDMAHNMLHALGINGHSMRASDTGYKTWNNQQQLLTPRDIKTLRLLYRCPIGMLRGDLTLLWEVYRKKHLSHPINSTLEAMISAMDLQSAPPVTPGFFLQQSSELSNREKALQAFFDQYIQRIKTA